MPTPRHCPLPSTVLLALIIPLAGAADDHAGGLGDDRIRYIGRWDCSAPTVFRSYWSTAYLRFAFTGTTLTAHCRGEVEAFIDGQCVTCAPGPDSINLTPTHLAAGTHTAVLAAAGQNIELAFQGLILDPGATTVEIPLRPLIEFVGDSITANGGRVAASKDSANGPATSNYSWLAAEAVGCDHVQVAFSGVALATGFGFFGDRTGFDSWYFRLKNCNHSTDNQPWGFIYEPQLVVVNLGTNDMKDGKRPGDAEFAATYAAFLRAIRAQLPRAMLVGMRPFGGFVAGGIARAIADLTAAGDAKVRYIDTSSWLDPGDFSDGIHPIVAGHAKAAARLGAALAPLVAAAAR
jgi:lysophospholipase L1-like esterase